MSSLKYIKNRQCPTRWGRWWGSLKNPPPQCKP